MVGLMSIKKTPDSLKDIFHAHTGKACDKWSSYLTSYEEMFRPYRYKNIRILEIGIQNGGSLEIWAQYFPNASLIVGCDIDPKCADLQFSDSKIKVIAVDANTDAAHTYIRSLSENFDIIIDDGSHRSSDIIRSFARYYPQLAPGGLYVVEDLHCSYWGEPNTSYETSYEGGLYAPFSSISFFKRLCDVTNFEHWGSTKSLASAFEYFSKKYDVHFEEEQLRSIQNIRFENSICFVKRGSHSCLDLGRRVVVGRRAYVSEDPMHVHGSMLTAPDQSTNLWGPVLGPSEAVVADFHDRAAREKAYVEALRSKDEALIQAVAEKKSAVDKLLAEVAQTRAQLLNAQLEISELHEIYPLVLKALRRPTRSYLVARIARFMSRLPGISENRRRKFRRSAEKRDPRHISRILANSLEVIDRRRTSTLSPVELVFQTDLDNSPLEATNINTCFDIVICVHNALSDVKKCLSSIVANTLPPYRLILIDDGSDDDTMRYLQEFSKSQGAVLFRNDVAGGYTKAANIGLKASSAPWVILLNSDVIVSFGWHQELLKIGMSDPKIGLVGPSSNTASWQSVPRLLNDEGDWADNTLPSGITVQDMQIIATDSAPPQGIELPFLNGFAFMIRRELINQIGVFDEEKFGAGYGEENDYCIRARNTGWKLIFAANSYVFHAQSKSYSSERRLRLSEQADINLQEKHTAATMIWPQVSICQESLATLSFRARIAVAMNDFLTLKKYSSAFCGKRVAILCPIGQLGGGGNILVQEARVLEKLGIGVWLINLSSNRSVFEQNYASIGSELYFETKDEIQKFLNENSLCFDAVIASAFFTVDWIPDKFQKQEPILGYYIQDYEPLFFDEGSKNHERARKSYTLLDRAVGLTKTNWNADIVAGQGHPRPIVVGASVDLTNFRPKGRDVEKRQSLRIAAMLRFEDGTDRRAPKRTTRVINQLIEKFGDRIEVIVFGSERTDSRKADLNPGVVDLGAITTAEISVLLRNTDIFMDLSIWQAMGLTAMEAMASGCAVVVPENGGTIDFCINMQNAIVIDTSNDETCFTAVCRLIENEELRSDIRRNATADICTFNQQRAACRILDALFGAPS